MTRALEYIRHGQIPFFRLPFAGGRGEAELAQLDVALLGVPYDSGVTYQPGARFAPYAVRKMSALVQPFHPFHRIDPFERLRIADAGNIALSPFHAGAMRETVELELSAIYAAEARPALVGGDHSITLPALRAAARRFGPLQVVHLDAHLDTSGPELWGDAYHHGTPFRHAIEERLITPAGLYQVGLRASLGDAGDETLGRDFGAVRIQAYDFEHENAHALGQRIAERIAGRPTYLSLDVDAIDPAFAPGTGLPVPGGISSRETIAFLRGLAGVQLVGFDLVEISPPLDPQELTARLGAELLYEAVALFALAARASFS